MATEVAEALSADYLAERVREIAAQAKVLSTSSTSCECNGPFADFFKTERTAMGLDCDLCGNAGYTFSQVNGTLMARECGCMVIYRNKLRARKSGLLNVLEKYTFNTYKTLQPWQAAIKHKALEYLSSDGKWFYIGGSVGSGKTHICTAICGELLKSRNVYYMPWRDDVVNIKANVNNAEEYQKAVGKLKIVEVLYIDDLLKGKYTDADIHVAFELLNYRYNNKLTTIISSEKSVDDIIDIDEAVGSRVYQMTKGFAVAISGSKNMRLAGDAE